MSEAIEILEHLRDNNLANLEMGCYEDGYEIGCMVHWDCCNGGK